MPFSAERLAELEACRGKNPIPADFDEFWAARIAEADAVPLDYEILPSDQIPELGSCTYYDLYFTGMGGARVYAKYAVPKVPGDGPVPLVLQFHGYPGCTRSWAEQSSWPGIGCAILSMDNPGQGGRSEDVGGFKGTTVSGHLITGVDGGPKNLYYVRLYQDQHILCRIVRELEGIDLSRVARSTQTSSTARRSSTRSSRISVRYGSSVPTRLPTTASATTLVGSTPTASAPTSGSARWDTSTP